MSSLLTSPLLSANRLRFGHSEGTQFEIEPAANDTQPTKIFPRQIPCPAAPTGTCRIIRKSELMTLFGIGKSSTRKLQAESQALADALDEPLIVGMRESAVVIFQPNISPKRIVLERLGKESRSSSSGWRRFEDNLKQSNAELPLHLAVREALNRA